MRSAAFVAVALFATASAPAAEITLPLNAASISAWSLTGGEIDEVGHDPLVLPSGAQLARSFDAERTAVIVESTPRFASDPEEWQVIELGSAAVVLAREGNSGILALAAGQDVLLHPHTIALDSDGAAAQPLALTFYRGGEVASLLAGGLRIDIKAPASNPSDVVLSTGSSESWAINRLAVVLSLDGDEIPEQFAAELAAGKVAERDGSDASGRKPSVADGAVSRDEKAMPSLADIAKAAADYRPLEVYTPPIVRSKRGEQIKAVLQALRKK